MHRKKRNEKVYETRGKEKRIFKKYIWLQQFIYGIINQAMVISTHLIALQNSPQR